MNYFIDIINFEVTLFPPPLFYFIYCTHYALPLHCLPIQVPFSPTLLSSCFIVRTFVYECVEATYRRIFVMHNVAFYFVHVLAQRLSAHLPKAFSFACTFTNKVHGATIAM